MVRDQEAYQASELDDGAGFENQVLLGRDDVAKQSLQGFDFAEEPEDTSGVEQRRLEQLQSMRDVSVRLRSASAATVTARVGLPEQVPFPSELQIAAPSTRRMLCETPGRSMQFCQERTARRRGRSAGCYPILAFNRRQDLEHRLRHQWSVCCLLAAPHTMSGPDVA